MKQFIKNNSILIIGIVLPVLLPLTFFCVEKIPNHLVESPKYDLLVSSGGSKHGSGYVFSVEEKKLHAIFVGSYNPAFQYAPPKLYRASSSDGSLKRIEFKIPEHDTQHPPIKFRITEAESFTIDPSPTAPDGYTYQNPKNGLGTVFFGYNSFAFLQKDSRTVKLLQIPEFRQDGTQTFIGWIISDGDK